MSTVGSNEDEDAAAGAPRLQAVLAIRALMLAGQQFRRAVAEQFGVGLSETIAANHLAISGPLSPSQLADRVGLTPSSVTALLDRLARADLATRTAHASDRRQSVITLTPRGASMQIQVQQWLDAALAGLDPTRLPEVTAALSDVATAVAAQAAKMSDPRASDEA